MYEETEIKRFSEKETLGETKEKERGLVGAITVH